MNNHFSSKIEKGDIRNTVLRHIKNLDNAIDELEQGKRIKEKK